MPTACLAHTKCLVSISYYHVKFQDTKDIRGGSRFTKKVLW